MNGGDVMLTDELVDVILQAGADIGQEG